MARGLDVMSYSFLGIPGLWTMDWPHSPRAKWQKILESSVRVLSDISPSRRLRTWGTKHILLEEIRVSWTMLAVQLSRLQDSKGQLS